MIEIASMTKPQLAAHLNATPLEHPLTEATKGHVHCSQAILLAYRERFDLSVEQCLMWGKGFRSGCTDGGTCGAILAAILMLGFEGRADAPTKAYMEDFKAKYGSCDCRDLKVPDQPCSHFIQFAAELYEKHAGIE